MNLQHSSLPRLRKGLLQGLDTLLDGLRAHSGANMILAQPSLQLPPGVQVTPLPGGLLREPDASERYPLGQQRWPDLNLHSICFPYLCCILEGEADLRIGFPAAVLARHYHKDDVNDAPEDVRSNGCNVLSLPAPSFLFLPPGVAHADGGRLPWERSHPELARATILWVHLPPTEALCHISTMRDKLYAPQLSMRVQDTQLEALWDLLTNELEKHEPESDEIANALLLVLLLRLRRGLAEPSARVADGMGHWIATHNLPPPRSLATGHEALDKTCEYIQFNLHEPLSPVRIAGHVDLSPSQLKRIFRNLLDTTVMDYVTRQRLEAAKGYLRCHSISIAEISSLGGFPQRTHFSRVFRREAGMSPRAYRRRNGETQ